MKESDSDRLKDEVISFKEKLNKLLCDDTSRWEEIVELSQKLDTLILKYYKDCSKCEKI